MKKLECSEKDYYIDGADEYNFEKLREYIFNGKEKAVAKLMDKYDLDNKDDGLKLSLMIVELKNEMQPLLKDLRDKVETLLLDTFAWPFCYCKLKKIVKEYWPLEKISSVDK